MSRSPEGAAKGSQVAWRGEGWAGDQRWVTLGGEEGFKERNWGMRRTYRESMDRELTGENRVNTKSETGGTQVSRGTHRETTQNRYAGTETVHTHVVR